MFADDKDYAIADLKRVESLESGDYIYEQIESYFDEDGNSCEKKTTGGAFRRVERTRTTEPREVTEDVYQDFLSKVEDMDAFIKRELPPIKHYVEDFLTQGMTMFAADSKWGKSWNCLTLGICLAKGEDYLGLTVEKPYKVLYIPLEDMEEGTSGRMRDLDQSGFGGNFSVMFRNSLIDNESIKIELLHELIAREGYDVVMIDTLAQFTEIGDGGGNAYQVESRMLKPLHELARKNKIAVLMVTHTNQRKLSSGNQQKISGSSAMAGSSDNFWIGDDAGITVSGRFIKDSKTYPFFWSKEQTKMIRIPIKVGNGRKTAKPIDVMLPVVQELTDWFSNKDLVEMFEDEGYDKNQISRVLKKWIDDNLVEKKGKGSAVKYKWI